MTTPTTMTPSDADMQPRQRPSRQLVLALLAGVLLLAVLGYWRTGTPNYAALSAQAEQAQAAQAAASAAGGPDAQQLAAMVDKLVEHLKAKPDDGQGWAMLGRAQSMLGKFDEALEAYRKALPLRPDDARVLTDYAETLGMKNGRTLDGEPTKLLERAIAIDPNAQKALALAGAAAYDRRDFATAVKHWEQLLKVSPPDADFVHQVQAGIADARQQGKLPPPAPGASAVAAAGAAAISGTVTLAPALRDKAAPNDTVFVYARAVEGPRMPLALLRKQVKDLPLTFTLDDTMAMNPALTLSSAARVVVVARISKSGQATPQPGDLSGESTPAVPGAKGVNIEIGEAVGK